MHEQEKERIKQIIGGDDEQEKEQKASQIMSMMTFYGRDSRMGLVHELDGALTTWLARDDITQEMADALTPEERLASLKISDSLKAFITFQNENE